MSFAIFFDAAELRPKKRAATNLPCSDQVREEGSLLRVRSGDNFGFWTDSNMTFNPAEYKVVPDDQFGSAWSLFQDQWAANRASTTATQT